MILAVLALLSSQQASPSGLNATGPWMLGRDGMTCIAQRSYGASQLFILSSTSGTGGKIMIAGPQLSPVEGDAAITIAPQAEPFKAAAMSMVQRDVRVNRFDTTKSMLEALEGGTSLQAGNSVADVKLSLDDMSNAIRMIRDCRRQVVAGLGVDPKREYPLPEVGEPGAVDMSKVVSFNDYPTAAIRAHAQGRSVTLVSFDKEGKAVDCRIAESSGNVDLDRASCTAARRLKRPPFMVGGNPGESWALLPFIWTLP